MRLESSGAYFRACVQVRRNEESIHWEDVPAIYEKAPVVPPFAAECMPLAEARAQLDRARAEAKEQAVAWAQIDKARVRAEEQAACAAAEASDQQKKLLQAREDLRAYKAAANAEKSLWVAGLLKVVPITCMVLVLPLY